MDLKQVKELIAAMEKSGLKKIRIKEEKGYELELESAHDHPAPPHAHRPEHSHHHFAPTPAAPPMRGAEEEHKEKPAPGAYVKSPMVGTYYSAPSPDDPDYVKVGDEVGEDTVICIIEAMKVMNEVKAGKKGKVAEILVDNADAVEFGTKLLRIV